MKTQDIFFSVIIPTRNRPKEFKKALDSVLSQTNQSFEVIVVNDGTTSEHKENYAEIAINCPEKVRFINLIERTRGHGHCFARNQGVDAAQGKFICFLDDDDWWLDDNFLQRAAESVEKYKADFYFANQKAITHDGEHIKNVWVENLPEKLPENDPRFKQTVFPVDIKELLLSSGFPHMNCWTICKKLYIKIGGMDENLRYEPDRDIYIRALDKARTILYDKNLVALHNIPDQTKSSNASTLTNKLEKLLFQQRTADKGVLFSKNKDLIKFCTIQKGFILKKIAEYLANEKQYNLAFNYAKQGLTVSFNIKWMSYCIYLWVKNKITP